MSYMAVGILDEQGRLLVSNELLRSIWERMVYEHRVDLVL